jgi:hypothetical protein
MAQANIKHFIHENHRQFVMEAEGGEAEVFMVVFEKM